MPDLTLADLVANGTMSAEIAGLLATAAAERRGLLFVAIPRLAGKTTTMDAALAERPPGTPVHRLTLDAGPGLGIPGSPDGGYLVMAEIARTPFPHYLWGTPVRRVFAALGRGWSLATALHERGVDEAFEVICRANAVPDAEASALSVAVYLRTLGPDWTAPTGRRVAEVREIEAVRDGRPLGRVLHRWDEARDRFVTVDRPALIGTAGGDIDRDAERFGAR